MSTTLEILSEVRTPEYPILCYINKNCNAFGLIPDKKKTVIREFQSPKISFSRKSKNENEHSLL